MKYYNTNNPSETVSFSQAVIQGLASQNGLFMPESIPTLDIWTTLPTMSRVDIAMSMLSPFTQPCLDEATLRRIVTETLSFDTPVVNVSDNKYCLELFHGPTQAFKDMGARFMSRCLAEFRGDKSQPVTVLTATSGDTGSAVANGFHQVEGVNVKILFPKGGVSAYQEYQMTSLGDNIQAFEVEGTFDDCQALVKRALSDDTLRARVSLSSANSINVARLLPQMLYYAFAVRQLMQEGQGNLVAKLAEKLVFSVPSGNFGNLTAGVLASKMGLPVKRFIASCNANDTVHAFLQSGDYQPKPSVETVANAMDVGAPSNFVRLFKLFDNNIDQIRAMLSSARYENEEILRIMRDTFANSNYVLDPHGATGYQSLVEQLGAEEIGLFLGTASPIKFLDIVQRAIPNYEGVAVDLSICEKTSLANNYEDFIAYL